MQSAAEAGDTIFHAYRVNPRGMKPLLTWIAYYRAFWTEHVDRLDRLLEKLDE